MRVFLLFLLVTATIHASSQIQVDSLVEFSRLEKMLMEPSRVIQVKSRFIGVTTDNFNCIGVIEATDLTSREVRKAISFERSGNYDTLFSPSDLHIDMDDLKSLLQTLQLFKKIIDDKNTSSNMFYQYTTSNFLVLAMSNRELRKNKWDINLYQRYKNYNVALPYRALRIREDEINSLIMLLEKIAAQ